MSKPTLSGTELGINLLSIDAGSPGGALSQVYILAEFMRRLKERLELDEDQSLADHFDMIGGSGLGAFVALCIGTLRMTIDVTIDALCVLALSVFYEGTKEERITVFNSQRLKETLAGIIEQNGHSPDAMINTVSPNPKCKTVLLISPVVDISSCHVIRDYRSRRGTVQCTILEVALACVSTASLFDHAEITPRRLQYTSAGIHHTNPIMTMLVEAEKVYGGEQRISCIMSLGAGTATSVQMAADFSWLDVHGLLQAMEIEQQQVTANAERQFGHLEAYFRFSVDKGVGSVSLHDWTHWEVDKIEAHVREYLKPHHQSNELDAAIGCLLDRKGTATLNHTNHATGITVAAKPIPPVTPFFVLRRKAWSFIEKNLVNAPKNELIIFVISGLGGCGKSTLFSYYVKVHGSKYSHTFFIDASSVHSIKTDLQNAVRSLGPEHSQKTWEEALQYFEEDGPNKNWLIGFDSADDPSIGLQNYVPKSEHGTVFITSRNRDLCFLTSRNLHWEMGPMTQEEALDTLLRSAQRNDSPSEIDLKDGAELVDRLDGLALAVVQAGVYCFQRSRSTDVDNARFSFRQYLEEMDQNHSDLMKYSVLQSLDGYDKSVYQSLNMSYSALPQLSRDFLHLCAYFHRSAIPLLMLESSVDSRFRQPPSILEPEVNSVSERKLGDLLDSHGGSTTIHLHKIVFSLKMFSLVVTSMTPNSVMLNYHALVNTWSRDILSSTQQQQYSAMATRVVSACGDDKYYRVHTSLMPHIREILKQPRNLHLSDMQSFAWRLLEGGMGAEAEALYRQINERCAKEFGKDHRNTLVSLSTLANSVRAQGRYEEAVKMEQEGLDRQRSAYSENDEQYFKAENNLAVLYTHQQRWSEAEEVLLRILGARKKKFSLEHPDTLSAMHNLAMVYFGQKRYQEAIKLEEEVLDTRKQVLGKDDPYTVSTMVNLANSYRGLNRLEDAQKLLEEALEIMKNTNGKDNPSTLKAMFNLANTYQMQGKHSDALTLGEEALDRYRRVLGKKHPDTLHTMNMIAKIYFLMERMPEGMQLQDELRELEGGQGKWSQNLIEFLQLQQQKRLLREQLSRLLGSSFI